MMKKIVYIVNVLCGLIMNEVVFVYVLKMNEIEGVVFDVFEFELKIIEELKELKNVVFVLYVGNVIFEICDVMVEMVVRNILVVLNGEELVIFVN